MTRILAVDLAARKSGWVLVDIGEQPYIVVAHGVIEIKGQWSELACWETWRAWDNVFRQFVVWGLAVDPLDCIAYEIPGRSDAPRLL